LREQIARTESSLQLNQARQKDISLRQTQLAEALQLAKKRKSEAEARITKTEKEAETAELNYREARDQLQEIENNASQLDSSILEKTSLAETKRSEHQQLISLVSQLGRTVSAADSQLVNLQESKTRLTQTTQQLTESQSQLQQTLAQAQQQVKQLEQEADGKDSALAETRKKLQATKEAQVIEELEKSLEGINAGARELLKHADDKTGPMSEVIGLVADLVNVNVQHAALVDVALGDIAQFVIVKGNKLINQIAAEKVKVGGRVGLIQLDEPPTLGADPGINLNGIDGVIGRADRLVQVQPKYAEFIRKMLGGTWLVKTLSIAIDLRANHESADRVRFITLDGEIVEADGSVVVGPKSTAAGLVSRRSELRALKREIERLDGEQETCRAQVKELTDKLTSRLA